MNAQTRDIVRKAYEFALNYVGQDKDSGEIWIDYIEFLRSGEASPFLLVCFPSHLPLRRLFVIFFPITILPWTLRLCLVLYEPIQHHLFMRYFPVRA